MENKQKNIYVLFSSTPYKLGEFIRKVTNHEYNHVSICLDIEGVRLYSFARIFKRYPFYGGFVKESTARFNYKGKCAAVKLCSIPVNDEQYEAIKKYVLEMEQSQELYLYNHFSAVATVFKKRVEVKNAYTCVEFATIILNSINHLPQSNAQHFYSVSDLETILQQYVVYEGPFNDMALRINDDEDTFDKENKVYTGMYLTLTANARLVYFLMRHIMRY